MRSILGSILLLAGLSATAGALAQDEEPAPTRAVFHPMRAPLAIVALPRDLLDAPMKSLSTVPVFNRIFLPPLAILNGATSLLCWSFTPDGVGGGIEAWVDCLNMPRKHRRPRPAPMQGRPAWKNYFPNLRGLGVVTFEPIPEDQR